MKNADELLKRILLNMKYDSRKTLVENKEYIFEANVIPINTPLTQGIVGNVRSEKYPELGKWGDGNCKCSYTDKLVFDKSCCKTPTITVDPAESLGNVPEGTFEINGIDYNGNPITLPPGTKVGIRYSDLMYGKYKQDYDEAIKLYPKMVTHCKLSQQYADIKTCVLNSVSKLLENVPDGAIMTFNYEGLWYNACWSKTTEKPTLQFKWTGYFGATKEERSVAEKDTCVGTPWDPNKLPDKSSPNANKTLTGIEGKKTKNTPESYEYKPGNEVTLPLIK
jgi:hypothetical protein